jgi:hypothetical protein
LSSDAPNATATGTYHGIPKLRQTSRNTAIITANASG